jgi:hypothetical protein
MLGDGPAAAFDLLDAFAAALAPPLPVDPATFSFMRLPFFGLHMRKCLCALRNGCRPMIACTFLATSAGMLGAFCAAV